MLTVGLNWSQPYFLADDIKYEATAYQYLFYAKGPIDFDCIDSLTVGYLQAFWPTVMCLSAGIFRTYYAGRFVNIALSTACIKVVYNITLELSGNEKTALFAGKLFAYLPINILFCCFPIKDVYLTLAVMYAFYIFLLLQNRRKPSIFQILLCIGFLVGAYFTRGAIVELMIVFLVIYLMDGAIRRKRYLTAIAVVLLAVIAWVLYGDYLLDAFSTKFEDYSDYNTKSDGLALLQMQNPWEVYKLPFAYFFATLQPMAMNILGDADGQFWLRLMRLTNISIYPIAIGNILYVFQKKHNFVFWLCGVVIYCAVISLSLGIFRHYMFLLPLEIINSSLYFERNDKNKKLFLTTGCAGLFMLVLIYSMLIN